MPRRCCFNSYRFFFAFCGRLYEKYSNFFGKDVDESSDWFGSKWGWMGILFDIAEKGVFGDITQVEQRYVIEIINYLSYCKDRNKHQEEESNKTNKRNEMLSKNRTRY